MFRKLLFVGLVLAMVASVASANLVARYEFQSNYKDSTGDVDGSYQNGTPYGLNVQISFTGDPTNGHLVLDNRTATSTTGSYVDLGKDSVFNITSAITLSAWVNPDVAFAAAKDMPFVQNGDEVGIKLKSNDTLEMYIHGIKDSTLAWYVANIPKSQVDVIWADGKFHLVTGTYDSAVGVLNLYIDGGLVSANTAVPVDTLINLTTDTVRIGGDSKAGHETRLYTGLLDDVRIYDNALSAEQVKALVPEPATIALLGLGGLTLLRRRK